MISKHPCLLFLAFVKHAQQLACPKAEFEHYFKIFLVSACQAASKKDQTEHVFCKAYGNFPCDVIPGASGPYLLLKDNKFISILSAESVLI